MAVLIESALHNCVIGVLSQAETCISGVNLSEVLQIDSCFSTVIRESATLDLDIFMLLVCAEFAVLRVVEMVDF